MTPTTITAIDIIEAIHSSKRLGGKLAKLAWFGAKDAGRCFPFGVGGSDINDMGGLGRLLLTTSAEDYNEVAVYQHRTGSVMVVANLSSGPFVAEIR